jgi:hypothetical protein
MEQAQYHLASVYQWLNSAYRVLMDKYGFVNGILALIIALIVVSNMRDWSRFWPSAAWATVVYFAADVLLPVIVNHVAPQFPAIFELNFWRHAGLLFAGYVIVIALLFLVKQTVLGPRPMARI